MSKILENESKKIISKVNYALDKKLKSLNLVNIENYLNDINKNLSEINNEYKLSNRIFENKFNHIDNKLVKLNKDILFLKKSLKIPSEEIIEKNKYQYHDYNEMNELIDSQKNVDSDEENNLVKNKSNISLKKNKSLNNLEPFELEKVSSFQSVENFDYIDLKPEKIIIDLKIVKKCLHEHCLKSDLILFKLKYIDEIPKTCYSIRNIKNNFQYWLNGSMHNDDENTNYIKNTIVSNISHLYLQINNFEDYEDDMDLFLKNQEYILNMSSVKYKNRLIKDILKIIDL